MCSTTGANHFFFRRAVPKRHFEKVILTNFISAYANLLQHFICTIFRLIEDYKKCTLRKEPVIAPFVARFKTATLRKSY